MLCSQMTAERRRELLDNPRHYPLRVAFLGKQGLLSAIEIAFLRDNGVDFDVDDSQLARILAGAQMLDRSGGRHEVEDDG